MEQKISSNLALNIKTLNKTLNIDKNFDIIYRVITIADREACFYFVDGMNKDEIMERLMEFLYQIQNDDMPKTAQDMAKSLLPYGEVGMETDINKIIVSLLSGVPILVIDKFDKAITVDFRTYPARGVEEPDRDKVLRGSRDGFVETVVFNTSLIRRRIRNPELIMEITSVGDSSHTDIVLSYMNDRISHDFLNKIRQRVNELQVDSLTMNTESLAEALYDRNWFNPFPKFKYTERPDTAAASILEGSLVIIVDNSPSVMILPATIFEIVEEADDYYFPPITGTYLRLTRMFINLLALVFTPLWILLVANPEWVPTSLSFILIDEEINIPPVIQLLILEFAIDGLKLASINTPSTLSMPLSVVAGIVLGDYTVKSGWFNSEVMLYMAFVAIANYTQASIELSYALKFFRILILILTGVFGIWGFAVGIIFTVLSIACNKTVGGNSYLYPLIPFSGKELFRKIFRIPMSKAQQREVK